MGADGLPVEEQLFTHQEIDEVMSEKRLLMLSINRGVRNLEKIYGR